MCGFFGPPCIVHNKWIMNIEYVCVCVCVTLLQEYKKQASDMDYDECHLYMRPVQFEFAPFKEDAGKPPPLLITSVQEDDSMIDRYAMVFQEHEPLNCDFLPKISLV